MKKKIAMPAGISSESSFGPDGSLIYTMTHEKLGALGRIVVRDDGSGQTLLNIEISNLDDGRKAQRETVLQQVSSAVEAAFAERDSGRGFFGTIPASAKAQGEARMREGAATGLLDEAVLVENHLRRPWPEGITVRRETHPDTHCLIYYFSHKTIGEVGRILLIYDAGTAGVRPEVYLESDGQAKKREALMDELTSIVNESFTARSHRAL